MQSIAGWWDSFELWVAGLPFIPQFLVVLVGMVPISFAIAYLLDRGVRVTMALLGRNRAAAATQAADTAELRLGPDFARPDLQIPANLASLEHAQSGVR
ncbi:hypothetical protein ACWDYH_14540 [Nocardia goodfellowii]|uniref:Aryl-alcohol dehydrogenase-like predicted oxidoreductase n=1 Tax=Nocardia goodfellowii TaxID=882446 RepID=A0ABS4QQT7_9NOCA|nr:hypothetical protein [Nocardia goodfellowii]MBP2194071.1 aryl-alcohol dehydrogenase-like predicted oxidoreductase [Nocardia goodfellowii]